MADRRAARLPRALHPAAWWLWATGVAVAASRTTNPVLLAVAVSATAYVAAARRPQTPWNRSYTVFLRIALVAVAVRVLLFAFVGGSPGTHVLVRLPSVPLPHWLAGLRLGGPISADGLLAATYDGMRLAVILVCVGAANTLTSPRRLLKSMPSALYEVGVATSVALAFAPQAVVSATRLRAARRLRGHPDHGLRSLRGLAVPVLEGALDRSVELAAAMDARGFGRSGSMSARRRLAVAAMTVIGLLALLASSYGLLVPDAPAATGLPLLLAGGAVTAVAFSLGARRGGRTRYRPDRWRAAEWLVGACGVAAAVALVLGPASGELPSASPPHWPPVPLVPLLGFLLAALPAWLAPPQPRPTRSLPVPAKPPRSAAAMVGAR